MSEHWYAESLRLTFFGVTGWTQRPIFAEIAGVVPAQINAQPPMQIHQEMGNLSEAYLSVSQQPGRIDVVLSDQPTRNTVDSAAPNYKPLFWIAPYKDSIEIFDRVSSKTVSVITSATRVAYSVTLIQQNSSAREAIKSLHRFLPTIDFDSDHDTDISFQINRPRQSGSGLINRLAKWDSIQTTTMQFAVGLPLAPPIPRSPPIFAARIYIDISTDAENLVPFNSKAISGLVDLLRDNAIEIAEKGDIK